jgi:hypothetical protein
MLPDELSGNRLPESRQRSLWRRNSATTREA